MKKTLLTVAGLAVSVAMLGMSVLSSLPMQAQPGAVEPTQKHYSGEMYAIGDALAAAETAEAQETRTHLDNIARATSDTLALSAQGTRQFQDGLSTSQAQIVMLEITQNAMSAQATSAVVQATSTAESVKATSTAESNNSTATATAEMATATVAQAERNRAVTEIQATSQAITRKSEIAESRQILTTFAGYGILFIVLAGVAVIVAFLLPAIKTQLGKVYRDERGDLPLMTNASYRSIDFLDLAKSWNPLTRIIEGEASQPLLTSQEIQDNQSERADYINLSKGGRPSPVVMQRGPQATPQPAITGEQWTEENINWPSQVNLLDVFSDRTPSLNNLVVGITPQPDGRQKVLSVSLHEMMHTLAVGASGWGKSTWLRSFLWQIATAQEPVDVVAVDINGASFNILRDWDRLLYPVARTTDDAKAVLGELLNELARRKALFENYPLASKLTQYNRWSDNPLPPVIVVADEGTNLLNQDGIGEPLRELVQCSRQYGLYILLAGQSAKHSVIDTQIRDNFSTRLCFRTSPTSSRVVLDDRCANGLQSPGRAFVQLVGRELVQVQGAMIDDNELAKAVSGNGPRAQLPEHVNVIEIDEREQRVADLLNVESNLSDSAIAKIVYGYQNSRVTDLVRAIRDRQTAQAVV